MTTENARIKSTILGYDDGHFTLWLVLDFGGAAQSFGGYALKNVSFIADILEVVGVKTWEDLPNKYVRVQRDDTRITAIGNILFDKWLFPQ